MRHRGYRNRSDAPKYTWVPWMTSKKVSLPNDTTTEQNGVFDYLDIVDYLNLEGDATVERIRGRLVIVKSTTGVGQFVVAGRFIEKDLAIVGGAGTPPDLFSINTGDDFPLWLPFACVDNDATSQWNGHNVDVKARRKINKGSVLQILWKGKTVNTAGTNEDYFIGVNLRVLIKTN